MAPLFHRQLTTKLCGASEVEQSLHPNERLVRTGEHDHRHYKVDKDLSTQSLNYLARSLI
jgi:hypothetical protein